MKKNRIAIYLSAFFAAAAFTCCLAVLSAETTEYKGIVVGIDDYTVTVGGKIDNNFIDNTMTLKMTAEDGSFVHLDSFGAFQNGRVKHSFNLAEDTGSGVYSLVAGMYDKDEKVYDAKLKFVPPSEAGGAEINWCDLSEIGTVYPQGSAFYVHLPDGTEDSVIEYSLDSSGKNQLQAAGKYTYVVLPEMKNGYHNIDISVKKGGTEILSKSEKFTVMKKYRHQFMDEFNVRGACTHYAHGTMLDSDVDIMNFAGMKTMRDGIKWSIVETGSGFNWDSTDKWLNQLRDNNIGLATGLAFNNYRVHTMYTHYDSTKVDNSNYIPRAQKDIEFFTNYVKKSLDRYPYMDGFELWNEPNSDTGLAAADYTDLLMNTAVEVKKAHRFADLSALSLFGFRETEWTQENFTSGMYPYMTAIAFHPYVQGAADTGSQERKYEEIYQLIVDNGGWKNMNITENGWSTYKNGATEENAAINLVKQNILSEKYDLTGSYWYDLIDDGTDVTNKEHFFGIITKDRKVKPGYIAYEQLNERLAGAIYIGEVKAGAARIFVYAKDGEPVLLAWVPGGKQEQKFNSGITAEDIYGNEVAFAYSTVSLDDSPIYISGADKSWFLTAAEGEILNAASAWSAKYSGLLPTALIEKADAVFSQVISLDDEKLSELHNEYKNVGLDIIAEGKNGNLSEMQTSSALYEFYRIMRLVNRLYILSYNGADVTSLNSDINSAIECSGERYYNDFNIMQYSEELLRYAEKFHSDAELVLNMNEQNPMKNGVISGWDMMSETFIEWFREFSSFERALSYGMLMNIQLDNNSFIDSAKEGKQKDMVVYVNNKGYTTFKGKLNIYDENEVCLYSSPVLTAAADQYKYLKTTFPIEKPAGGNIGVYTLRLIDESGKVIAERKHEINVYRDEMEEGYPSHEGKGNYGADNYPRNPDMSARASDDSDETRIFTVDGKRFVLLDKDEQGNLFVAADDAYGVKGFNLVQQSESNTEMLQTTGKWKYNPEVSTNIAHWLNTEFLKSGNTNSGVNYKLPEKIISNLVEKDWTVEFAEDLGVAESYSVKAEIALMSATEWAHYSDRLGFTPYNAPYKYPDENGKNTYVDENGNRVNNGWWLRTAYNNPDDINLIYGSFVTVFRYQTHPGLVAEWSVRSGGQTKYIRPVFWLKPQFFEENRVDINSAGSIVKAEIAEGDLNCLKEIYSEEELIGLNKIKIGVSDDRTKVSVLAPEAFEADIIFASYDESKKLTGISINSLKLEKGIKEYNVVPTKTGENEKVFVWNSAEAMIPAVEAQEIGRL